MRVYSNDSGAADDIDGAKAGDVACFGLVMTLDVFSTNDHIDSWRPKSLSVAIVRESGAQKALTKPATPETIFRLGVIEHPIYPCLILPSLILHVHSSSAIENTWTAFLENIAQSM